MMNTKRILDEEKVKDFVGDFNKYFEDLAKRYKKDAEKIKTRRECFWKEYPEIFRDSLENEVEMDNYPGNESFTITLTDLWYFSMRS